MSKTDKTRPWRVKAMDRPGYRVPEHDHRFGPCDLPARPTVNDVYAPAEGGRCYWGASQVFWYAPEARCGCPLCTGHFGHQEDNRRDRQATKRALRRWVDGDDW